MNIVEINAVFGYGSTGLIVKDLCNSITCNDDVAIPVYQTANMVPDNGYKMGNIIDWKWHACYTRISGKQAYASYIETKKLLKFLSKVKPDIVHLHNLHSNYINLNLLLHYLATNKISTIITLHDCWFFTGKCFHFIDESCENWKNQCHHCPKNRKDVPSLFFDRTSRVFRDKQKAFRSIKNLTVVGCSNWITEMAKSSPIFKGKKFRQIYNGIDLEVFYPREDQERLICRKKYGINSEFIVLGMANKWITEENNDAVERISNVPGIKIILLGCNDMNREKVKKYKSILPFDYIKARDEMSRIYATADVFVNLTFADTLPTVNMEALASGTPVITYDIGGSAELVCDGKTGYVVKKDEIDSLIHAIENIKKGKIKREDCAVYAKINFDAKSNYKKYMKIYQEIANHV